MKKIEGNFKPLDAKFVIVNTTWNEFVVDKLVDGAVRGLTRHGISEDDITLVSCPGAFEVPLVVKKLAESGKYDAVIALGAVIRGSTPHFDYVAGEAVSGLGKISLDTNVPISFGILTVDTIEQAIERAGTKAGNKGEESALCAYEMVSLLKQI
ncbi:MAG: 6,7-dimethyl-8-ribityllumazine synthase [Marinomonas sp.]|uniref:6,7-dimethyl-8-ribityllumazine synthase n=1 Tax=unclassified Marinomonas TaxID=196814 RepID=UPI0005F9A8A5|nr:MULTISPECIES: 6,7-dimethyl-8-ribityllumazine synthase [unclassified Marinomonas]KJZ13713.1 6,7-dimethyl-8-ribityllumazine synthase [Marinomonas sp. S3726]KZM44873.1 6,7-dimethyl-8-ribityllumazine synthase [Marinomonas sp. SBI22]KZM46572.1 6,7-dimethyl-8-ribityllumazine synthase [Marinomonas sp. SBI8L]